MNLVIGNTSQLSQYFPNTYVKISSRNIPDEIFNTEWNSVYICFAEQKTYINNDARFYNVNVDYTLEIIKKIKAYRMLFYSTAELWNNCVGPIDLSMPYNYHKSDYVQSKEQITDILKKDYPHVIIAYPFNFNSIYRNPPFLFGKIFDSIVHNKKIEIGDTYYYRELLHPSYIVKKSIELKNSDIIGTGQLYFVNYFIKKLYRRFGLNFEDLVKENLSTVSIYRKNIFYSACFEDISEDNLIDITVEELNAKITNKTC